MRFTRRVALITMAVAALAPAAAVSGCSAKSTPPAATGAFRFAATIPVSSAPGRVAVNPATDTIYLASGFSNVPKSGMVVVVSGRTYTVEARIRMDRALDGIAVNPATNTIYVTSADNTLSVISGQANTVKATIRVGRTPGGVAVNPATNTIYVANTGSGTVSVISGQADTVVGTVPVGRSPFDTAVNPKTNTIWVTNAKSNTVSVISGRPNRVRATIGVGGFPEGIAVNPVTGTVYVTNAQSNTVSVISGRANKVVRTVPVGAIPIEAAANPKTNTIWIANAKSNTVSVINGLANTVVATIGVGNEPGGIAVDPVTNITYVVNSADGTMSALVSCQAIRPGSVQRRACAALPSAAPQGNTTTTAVALLEPLGLFVLLVAVFVWWVVALVEVAGIPVAQFRAANTTKTLWVLITVLTAALGPFIWRFGKRKDVRAAAGMPGLPAGWYLDPKSRRRALRWWDGTQWTGARHDLPSPPTQADDPS